MDRLSRSFPMLALCGVVAFLTYCQFEQKPAVTAGNEQLWAEALVQRLESLEVRTQQPITATLPAIEERVIELPEDSHLWSTVVVYSPDDYGQRLKSNFQNTPQLLALKAQTQFYELPPTHFWVRQHLAGAQFPLVLVQRPISATEAKVIYKATGANVPSSGALLADEIATAIEDCRPRPTPTPTPPPNPTPVHPDPIPDLRPAVVKPPEQDENLSLLSYAAIAASALGGAYFAAKREG